MATVTVTSTPVTLDATGAAELGVTNTGGVTVFVNSQRVRRGQRLVFDARQPLTAVTQGGSGTSTVDTDVASPARTGGGATRADQFAVDAYGADPTGTADSTAGFVAAVAAASAYVTAGAKAATVVLSPGTYKVTGDQVDIASPFVSVTGPGANACTIAGQGSGSVLTLRDAAWASDVPRQHGRDGGFTIDGAAMTGTAIGIHYRDLNSGHLDDLYLLNFGGAGGIGIWMHKALGWTERTLWTRVVTRNCASHIVFDGDDEAIGGSFMYHRALDIKLGLYHGQQGLVFTRFAQFEKCVLNVIFNALPQTGGNRQVLMVIGTTATDSSRIRRAQWAIQGERGTGGTSVSADLDMGANAELNAFGTFWFDGSWTAGNSVNRNAYIAGQISAPSFTKKSVSAGSVLASATASTEAGTVIRTALTLTDSAGTNAAQILSGASDPNTIRTATPGSLYLRTATPGTSGTRLYVNTGTGSNSVWTALAI